MAHQRWRLGVGRKTKVIRLSAGEMEIMAMLWKEGPLPLGAAHQAFARYGRAVSYPTMQTRLNRMVEKGLVTRSDERPALYAAAVSAERVGRGHVSQLLERIGRDQAVPLVAHLISENLLTSSEIEDLQRLLAQAEKVESGARKPSR
jgi:BlaI family transcriptional regulator, penicillinase repressor